jgi:all-trans-retinol dehydrogenase (NAD+)
MFVTKAFLPAMMADNHGHVVTIASAAATYGAPKMTDYVASKWAAFGTNFIKIEINSKVSPRL